MPKRPKRIKVPREAPAVLVTLHQKVLAMRQELQALVAAGQAYARSVKLDPSRNYEFEAKDGNIYAVEQVPTAQVEGAEEKE